MYNADETAEWDEFEWEKALRESDDYASRYFQLLKRFCDLPGSNELIAKSMGDEADDQLPPCDYDCEECEDRWDCEFAVTQDWSVGGDRPPDDDEEPQEEGDPGPPQPGDALFFETDPVFVMLRQTAMGWCNVYAAMLPADARVTGVRVLCHIGRSLANLAYCIGDGYYDQPSGSIAFAKRSLGHLNRAVGFLNQMIQERPRLEQLLATIRNHLMKAREGLLEHLHNCRKRLAEGPADETPDEPI